jgi:Holliday junction resolvase
MATNKKLGNTFEQEFCEELFKYGFWVHNLAQNQAGQPADVIAVKNKTAYLIDCKVCSRGHFTFSRIEENQHNAMELWKDSGNGEGWFALKCGGHIFMLPHFTMKALAAQQSSISYTEMGEYGKLLDRWVKKCK